MQVAVLCQRSLSSKDLLKKASKNVQELSVQENVSGITGSVAPVGVKSDSVIKEVSAHSQTLDAKKRFITPMLAVMTSSPVFHAVNTVTHATQISEKSVNQTVQVLFRNGGIPRFYRGYVPGVINSALAKSISFGINGTILAAVPKEDRTVPFKIFATTVSVFTKIAACMPLENVKVQLQMGTLGSASCNTSSTSEVIRSIYQQNGLTGFYRTLPLATLKSLAIQVPYMLVFFSCSDLFSADKSVVGSVALGATASLAAMITTLPVDHLRVHALGNASAIEKSSLSLAKNYLEKSFNSKGSLNTVLTLYCSSPSMVIQLLVSGTFMTVGIKFFDRLYDALSRRS